MMRTTQSPTSTARWRVRRLAVARLVSIAGGEAAAIALAFIVYSRTHSAVWLSISFLFTFGAAGLLSPVAGTIGDRFDRKRVMIACDLAGGIAYLALAFVRTPLAMVAIAFFAEVVHAPFVYAATAAIPNVAEAKQLTWANSLLSVGSQAGRIVGPLIGGALVAIGGGALVFGVNSASFVASAAIVATVGGRYRSAGDGADDEYAGLFAGFHHMARDRLLRSLCVAWAVMMFAVNIVVVADVPLAKSFAVGAIGLGLIYTCDSTGGIIGSYAARKVPARLERVALLADTIAIAVAYFVVAASPWFVLVLVAIAFGLGVDSLAGVIGTGVIQRSTPDAIRARVFAAFGGLGMAANVVAFLIAGVLVDLVGPRGVYAIAASSALVAAVALLPAIRVLRSISATTGRAEPSGSQS
jgi:MFS family permease